MTDVTLYLTWGEVAPVYPACPPQLDEELAGPIEKIETPRSQCFLSVSLAVGG